MRRFRSLVVPALVIAALLGSASMIAGGRAATLSSEPMEGEVAWIVDHEVAAAEVERSGKPMLLYFTADWCPPCQQMRRDTWTDDRVKAMVEDRFVALKVDLDRDPSLALAYRVLGPPTVIVQHGDGRMATLPGYRGPDDLLGWLTRHVSPSTDPT